MQAYRTEAEVGGDGRVTIEGVPFSAGERVEVIVLHPTSFTPEPEPRYPLRGSVLAYDDPFGSVAEEDWDALK